MSTNDFTYHLKTNRKDEIGYPVDAPNQMVCRMEHMLWRMVKGVETLRALSKEMTHISERMAKGADLTAEKSNTVTEAAGKTDLRSTTTFSHYRSSHIPDFLILIGKALSVTGASRCGCS